MNMRQQRITTSQQEVYLIYLMEHTEFAASRIKDGESKYEENWKELTQMLNNTLGPKKSVDEWKMVFFNWKNQLRTRAKKLKQIQDGKTGPDDKLALQKLTDVEKRALKLWKEDFQDKDIASTFQNDHQNEQQGHSIQIPLPLHLETSNRTNHVPLNSASIAVSTADSRSMILSLENNVNVVSNIIRDSENLVKIKCGQCRKRFDTNEEMVAHQAKHLTESKYKCELCGKHFPSQSSVWKHTKAHSGERPFVCSICNKAFTQLANLQRHNLVHNGLKPYKCPSCQKAFSQHANMVKHQMLHTGEKPFKCKNCDKAFAQRANLKKHEMIHLGIRPYGCNICLKSYSQQSNLKKHILTHQKKNGKNSKNGSIAVLPPTSTANYVIYQCNICKQELSDISDFNKHIKVCNLNPMNNPHHLHHHSNGNGTATLTIIEPKKESIEIKTENMDEGSNNTHTPPVMSHIHHHMQQHTQHNHQQPQASLAAAHHQILTSNGHIITNFLDLNNHHLHHIDYGKH